MDETLALMLAFVWVFECVDIGGDPLLLAVGKLYTLKPETSRIVIKVRRTSLSRNSSSVPISVQHDRVVYSKRAIYFL